MFDAIPKSYNLCTNKEKKAKAFKVAERIGQEIRKADDARKSTCRIELDRAMGMQLNDVLPVEIRQDLFNKKYAYSIKEEESKIILELFW